MDMTKFPEFVLYWEASNSHKNLCVNQMILGKHFIDKIGSCLVKDRKHVSWLFCEPNGEGWVLARQVSERELKGLPVPLAHALDAVFVHVLP